MMSSLAFCFLGLSVHERDYTDSPKTFDVYMPLWGEKANFLYTRSGMPPILSMSHRVGVLLVK